jgi:hypothetical protein
LALHGENGPPLLGLDTGAGAGAPATLAGSWPGELMRELRGVPRGLEATPALLFGALRVCLRDG